MSESQDLGCKEQPKGIQATMSGNESQTSEHTDSAFRRLSEAVIVVVIGSVITGIFLWRIDDEIALVLLASLPIASWLFAERVRLFLTRLTMRWPPLLAVCLVVAAGLIYKDVKLWQDAQKRISVTRVTIVTEPPECQLEVNGRYNLYALACDHPADCVPFVLLKTAGVDAYYPRMDLEAKLTRRRGTWSVLIDALASPTQSETETPEWCKNVPVFDPQQPFDVYVALAPRGWANKFGDCRAANLGYRFNDGPIQGLYLLSNGIRESCGNR